MRIAILGSSGQIGSAIMKRLQRLDGVTILCGSSSETPGFERILIDTFRLEKTIAELEHWKPNVIINCAAWTKVDEAEVYNNWSIVKSLNENLPQALAQTGIPIIHFSTNFVFDGTKKEPYTEIDEPNPLSNYGRSKLKGDKAVLEGLSPAIVMRVGWVYSATHECFVTKLVQMLRSKTGPIPMISDQSGNPTSAESIARAVEKILLQPDRFRTAADMRTLVNYADADIMSRYRWATEIESICREIYRKDIHAHVAMSLEDKTKSIAARPKNGSLNCEKIKTLFGIQGAPVRQELLSAVASFVAPRIASPSQDDI